MKEIQDAINSGDYKRAEILLQKYVNDPFQRDDMTALFEAAVREHQGDRNGMWEAIQKGLLYDHRNYELYIMLGNYYLTEDLYRSYLCYENALFHCGDTADKVAIEELLKQFKEEYRVKVEKAAIIILSYDLLAYTKACVESIRNTTPESAREIIVVDNGSKDGSVEWLREQPDIILIENKENKGFPGGCNQGIRASSKGSDIFLLNNDTLLPENALFWLRMGLYASDENGAAGSVSNHAGGQVVVSGVDNVPELLRFGEQTNVPMRYPYEDRLFLVGFALLIKRSVIDHVGLLDERFFPGNNEDVDLGLRIIKAGYRNVLCKNSFILHFGSKTFDKDLKGYQVTAKRNREKINEKWGFDVDHQLHPKTVFIDLIEEPIEKPIYILDVGCGCGASMGYVRGHYPNARTYGIERVPEMAEIASRMGEVLCGDIEEMDLPWELGYFDYIFLGDILERLIDPEKTLKKLRRYLKESGHIMLDAFNVKHYSVILPLLKWGIFPYSDTGILRKTHVRMYTGVEAQRLVERSGYELERLNGITVGEPNKEEEQLIEGMERVMGGMRKETFLVYQYVLKAKNAPDRA